MASAIVSDSSFDFSWDVTRPDSFVEVFLPHRKSTFCEIEVLVNFTAECRKCNAASCYKQYTSNLELCFSSGYVLLTRLLPFNDGA